MTRAIRQRKDESGFTLIELLVVIIIIGILAAIAIPVFLNQRQRGWEAAVQADLRNAATAQETYLTENSEYTNAMDALEAVGFKYSSPGNYFGNVAEISVVSVNDGLDYCMQATANGDQVFSYSSPEGLTDVACS